MAPAMTQPTEAPPLRLVDGVDGPLLYDTNRVATYKCSSAEAYLLRQDEPEGPSGVTEAKGFDDAALIAGRDRIARLSGLSRSLARLDRNAEPDDGHPSYLFVAVCHACNLQCEYCYADGCGIVPDGIRMTRETALAGIDFLLKSASPGRRYIISFAGGEPLLNIDVIACAVAYARRRQRELSVNLELRILTNGTVMSPKILKLISDNDIFVQISLDGPPDVQDRLRPTRRGDGSSAKVMETIGFFKQSGFRGFRVRATLCHDNADIRRIEDYCRSEGLDDFSVQPAICGAGAALRMREADIEKIGEYYEDLASQALRRHVAGAPQAIPSDIAVLLAKLSLGVKSKRFCGAGRDLLVVTPEGHFYPCPALAGDSRFRMGDLGAGLQGGRAGPFQNRAVDDRPICRNCWARNLCGGGCMAQAISVNGDSNAPDAMDCALTKARIAAALRIHHRTKDCNKTADVHDRPSLPAR